MKGVRVQSLKGKRDKEKGISRHKPSISTGQFCLGHILCVPIWVQIT